MGMLQENKKSSRRNVIPNPKVLPQYLEKNENSLILEHFLLVSSCHTF